MQLSTFYRISQIRFALSYKIAAALVFSTSLFYFLYMTAPDSVWVNADHDGNNYVMAAKFLVLVHPTGAPLFNLINWVLIRLPIPGTDYFHIALWSAVASAGTTTLLYHITRRLLAPAIFMAAGLVVSQSTIVETYALITLIMVGAYYLHDRGYHQWKYVLLGIGLAIHHLPIWELLIFVAVDFHAKRDFRYCLWVLIALPFYLYVPIVNRAPYLWIKGEGFHDYMDYFFSQTGLIAGLAIVPPDNLFMRIHDISILFLTSFAAALPFLFIASYQKLRKGHGLLVALTFSTAVYYFTMTTSNAYIYLMPTIAFGALLIGCYPVDYISRIVIYCVALGLMTWNVYHYDIGTNLDRELSATNFYEQVELLPANAVVYTGVSGWQRGSIWLYNYENNQTTGIVSVSALALSDKEKLQGLLALQRGNEQGLLYHSVDTNAELKQARIEPWHPSPDEMIEAVRLERG